MSLEKEADRVRLLFESLNLAVSDVPWSRCGSKDGPTELSQADEAEKSEAPVSDQGDKSSKTAKAAKATKATKVEAKDAWGSHICNAPAFQFRIFNYNDYIDQCARQGRDPLLPPLFERELLRIWDYFNNGGNNARVPMLLRMLSKEILELIKTKEDAELAQRLVACCMQFTGAPTGCAIAAFAHKRAKAAQAKAAPLIRTHRVMLQANGELPPPSAEELAELKTLGETPPDIKKAPDLKQLANQLDSTKEEEQG